MNPAAGTKLPEEMTTCLCNLHFKLAPENTWLPEWKFNKATGLLILSCPNCNYSTPPFDNRNAVIAYWSLINKKGCEHALLMWGKYYELENNNQEVA